VADAGAREVPLMRDTDRDWAIIAENEPFFGVLANEQFRRERLTQETIDDFYASGEADVDFACATLVRHVGASFPVERALDFGAGVGRLAFAMAQHARRVDAVDIAPGMRDVGRATALAKGIANVAFSEVPAYENGYDWINSLIVFQHIPPARGYTLLADLLGRLASGGLVSLHFTVYRDARHTGEIERDLDLFAYDGSRVDVWRSFVGVGPGSMSMYDYDLGRLMSIFVQHDVTSLWLEHTDHAGCHGAWLFGRRSADR
jgi:SAM-dependent methyltransferase